MTAMACLVYLDDVLVHARTFEQEITNLDQVFGRLRQAAASSLSTDFDKITNESITWNMSFNPEKSHTLTLSPKGPFHKPLHLLSQQLS